MSVAVVNASQLKSEIRLAQAISQFQADLSDKEKDALRTQSSQLQSSAPDQGDVMRLTAEIDKPSRIVAGKRCFGPRLTNFLHAVQQFAALGDVVVGGSQNLIACTVWMLVRMSLLVSISTALYSKLILMPLKSIATYSSYLDKLSNLFMDIGRSAPRYQTMALLYPQSKRLQADLAEYFVVAVSFCHQIWKFAQKAAISKFLSALSDADLRTYQSNFEKWANAIKEEVNILMAKQAHENSHEIAGIKTIMMKGFGFASHQRNLQTKLRVLDLCSTYDFQTAWKQTRKIGHCSLYSQSTDYQNWRDQMNSSTLIYMGKLGSGKSVLLANIVEDITAWIQRKSVPVAYFFCRHDSPESLQPRTIIGSLARQLLLSIPDLASSKELPDEITSNLDLEGVFSLLHRVLGEIKPVYIVLDGLDECDSTTGELLLQQLQKLQKTIPLHLCISIRLGPAKNQGLSFKELTTTRTVFMPDDNPDIVMFIEGELANLVSSGKLKLGDPVLVLDIQQKLMDGSQGMFLWVALQLQSLCTMKTDNDIRQALNNLPKDLPETFTRILQGSGAQDRAYQRRILEFVAAAFRALTTEELREALSVVPGNTDWRPSTLINDFISTLACCGGLVIVDEEEKTVRLVHHSFKQFLVSGFYGPNDGYLAMDLAHKNFADTIVTYLNYGVFGTQLSTIVAPRIRIGTAPSQIVREAIGSSTVRRIALELLKSRKRPDFDIGKVVMDAGGRYDNLPLDQFHFHDYAKSFCMFHILRASKRQLTFIKLLTRLLERDVINANATKGNDKTPLSWAAENGHETVVKLLVEAEADIESKDVTYDRTPLSWAAENYGQTPLWWAAKNGHEAVVKLLVEAKANIESKDSTYGETPLLWAARSGHKAVVKLLVEAKANIESKDSAYGRTPLLWAAMNGHEAVVKLLVEAKADIESKNTYGQTPLWWAAMNGHEAVVKLLVEAKADIESKNTYGQTPLRCAVENRHEAVVKLLVEAKADIESKNNYGQTPLWCAVKNGHEAVFKLLVEAKADIESKDVTYGQTPLSWAAENGHEAVVKLLVEAKADIESKSSTYGETPLLWAAINGHEAVVKLLVEAKANIESKDSTYGETPLLWAARSGHKAVVKLLVEAKANIESKDSAYGRTPLLWAAMNGHEAVVKLLAEAKADIESKDSISGHTPLSWAAKNGHEAVIKLLVEAKADIESKASISG